jgi:hypothetical protein
MTATELFVRQHALFRAVLDSLEQTLAHGGEPARAVLSEALRMLLPALDCHAEIEGMVFRHAPDTPGGNLQALAEVSAQHQALAMLRNEVLSALEQSEQDLPFTRLKGLSDSLASDLRRHLDTEELRLWPLYQGALQCPLDALVPMHFERRSQALERTLSQGIIAIRSGA